MVEQNQQKSNTIFTLSYNAQDSDYANHRIDADQLVNIVENMNELINRTDRVINKRKRTVKLYLQAPVQAGSLEIPFLLENFDSIENSLEILKYLGIAGVGAIGSIIGKGVLNVLTEMKDKTIIEVRTDSKSNEAVIVLDDEEITVDKKVAKLVTDPKIKEHIQNIVAVPLEGKTSPHFKIKLFEPNATTDDSNSSQEVVAIDFKNKQLEIIEKMETSPVPEVEVDEKEATIALTQISFTGSQKGWKMSYDGKTDISVKLLDDDFIKAINENSASFRKGDLFNVTLEITTRKINNREYTKYSILKVKNHMASDDRKIVTDTLKKKDE